MAVLTSINPRKKSANFSPAHSNNRANEVERGQSSYSSKTANRTPSKSTTYKSYSNVNANAQSNSVSKIKKMTNHGRLLTQNPDDKQNTINFNNKNMYIENAYERINRDRVEKDLNKLRTKDIYKDIKDNRERDKINAQN